MAKGLSLHVGVNSVDSGHYDGWVGALASCEADATDMEAVARASGYGTAVLLTREATRSQVIDAIRESARQLVAGDIFLITYAGHGGQVPDANGDEPDAADETWCLYDGELIDDELWGLWKGFAAGVRVVVLSDSCHSGTVTRAARGGIDMDAIAAELRAFGVETPSFRFMPPAVAMRTYRANRDFYDALGERTPSEEGAPAATIRLISGCQDNQTSADGPFNGLFTGTLLRVWNRGGFTGDYARFHADIARRMPRCQQPNHVVLGPQEPAFDRQRPFSIAD